jgi:DegV family protein with EDD domain
MSDLKRHVTVVTDSAAALSQEQIDEFQLFVARMEIVIDGKVFIDGPEGNLSDFYSNLASSVDIPTTSAPKPAEFLEQFRSAAAVSTSIICVTVSGRLSASNDAARVAAEMLADELPKAVVRVFDSGAAASSQALIALAAARTAADGGTLDDVEAAASVVAEKVRLVAMLDTLRFIHKSGRVPKIAVWVTDALNIKPVMEYSTEKIGAIARPRSVDRALDRILKEMNSDLGGTRAHVNVIHAGAPERAQRLRSWAADNLNCVELFVTQFHPFMGAHTGPGLVGASWWAE